MSLFIGYINPVWNSNTHAPCIRVWGRAERSYFLYCPPKAPEETANTRSVYLGAGTREEKLPGTFFTVHKKHEKIQRIHASCIRVRGRAERSYFLYCTTKNKRRNSEYTLRVFGCGDVRREPTSFTAQPQTREETANARSVYSDAGTRGEKQLLPLLRNQ